MIDDGDQNVDDVSPIKFSVVNREENATRLGVFRIDLTGIKWYCPKQSPLKAGPCLVKLPGSNFITLNIKFN